MAENRPIEHLDTSRAGSDNDIPPEGLATQMWNGVGEFAGKAQHGNDLELPELEITIRGMPASTNDIAMALAVDEFVAKPPEGSTAEATAATEDEVQGKAQHGLPADTPAELSVPITGMPVDRFTTEENLYIPPRGTPVAPAAIDQFQDERPGKAQHGPPGGTPEELTVPITGMPVDGFTTEENLYIPPRGTSDEPAADEYQDEFHQGKAQHSAPAGIPEELKIPSRGMPVDGFTTQENLYTPPRGTPVDTIEPAKTSDEVQGKAQHGETSEVPEELAIRMRAYLKELGRQMRIKDRHL